MNAQTYGISLLRQSGTVAARQLANVPALIRNDQLANVPALIRNDTAVQSAHWLTVLLFCDVHIHIGATLNVLQCLHVIFGCSYCHNNQLRLAPSSP